MASAESPAFFSYSREDSEFAMRLAGDLKSAGAKVWLDQLDISPGQQWDLAVEKAVNNCQEMLVVLSPAAVQSKNVMDEIAFALDENKTIVPVLEADCRIPFRLRRIQYVDFRSQYEKGLNSVLKALGVDQPLNAPAVIPEEPVSTLPLQHAKIDGGPEVKTQIDGHKPSRPAGKARPAPRPKRKMREPDNGENAGEARNDAPDKWESGRPEIQQQDTSQAGAGSPAPVGRPPQFTLGRLFSRAALKWLGLSCAGIAVAFPIAFPVLSSIDKAGMMYALGSDQNMVTFVLVSLCGLAIALVQFAAFRELRSWKWVVYSAIGWSLGGGILGVWLDTRIRRLAYTVSPGFFLSPDLTLVCMVGMCGAVLASCFQMWAIHLDTVNRKVWFWSNFGPWLTWYLIGVALAVVGMPSASQEIAIGIGAAGGLLWMLSTGAAFQRIQPEILDHSLT